MIYHRHQTSTGNLRSQISKHKENISRPGGKIIAPETANRALAGPESLSTATNVLHYHGIKQDATFSSGE